MSLTTYGARLDTVRLTRTLEHIFATNLQRQAAGHTGVPVCIWGTHGLGKTDTVKAFAKAHGWKFAYCAPAQFEETADLHGLPTGLFILQLWQIEKTPKHRDQRLVIKN